MSLPTVSERAIPARHDGICPSCLRAIIAWEHSIVCMTGKGWCHEACATQLEGAPKQDTRGEEPHQ
jgi:hypothetical protein